MVNSMFNWNGHWKLESGKGILKVSYYTIKEIKGCFGSSQLRQRKGALDLSARSHTTRFITVWRRRLDLSALYYDSDSINGAPPDTDRSIQYSYLNCCNSSAHRTSNHHLHFHSWQHTEGVPSGHFSTRYHSHLEHASWHWCPNLCVNGDGDQSS